MTDTGQVPGEGLPENAGMVEQPGVLAPGAYTYLDHSDTAAVEDDDLLLMPGQQGAWGNEMPQPAPAPASFLHEPGPHEMSGRDSGSIDVGAVRTPPPATPARRPLHLGPPTPDNSSSLVRSLADRGPAAAPMRPSGPPTTGPEYLDVHQLGENSPQAAAPWGASAQTQIVPAVVSGGTAAETGVPASASEPVPAPAAPEAAVMVAEGSGAFHAQVVPAGSAGFQAPGAPFGPEPLYGPAAPHDLAGTAAAQQAVPQTPSAAHTGPAPEGMPTAEAMPAPEGPRFPHTPIAEPAASADATPVPVSPPFPEAAPDVASFAPVPDTAHPADETPHAGPADAPGIGTPSHGAGIHASALDDMAMSPPPAAEPVAAASAPAEEDPAQAVPLAPDPHAPEPRPAASFASVFASVEDTTAEAEGAEAYFEEPAPQRTARRRHLAVAESDQVQPVGAARSAESEASSTPPHGVQAHGEPPVSGEQSGAPGAGAEFSADHSFGHFVPVEGTVPTTPYLAPTPPHALRVPPLPEREQQTGEEPAAAAAPHEPPAAGPAAEEPVATVPAPREGESPASEPLLADPEPVVAQQAEDLDTRAADQEESTAAVEEVRESTGPAAPGYDEVEREAVLRVMRERRDIRNGFRSDPIPHDVLLRVLEAAHTAPSVGHSQPWDFVVIRSAETRRTMHELAQRQREAYAKSLPKGRAKQFKELKIEAILDTPVNIVVTADPTRGGRHTLGRHTQPQMAPYSSALAVENLWLAARAEGLGVGWVSFFDEREMVRALGLPEHLEVVAYLCVGYVDEFPEEPELMQAGWSKRRPLSWVVHEETYGRRALPGEEPHDLLAETVASIRPLDAKALGEAWERQKRMTKPAGALGMLEIISAQLSGLSRQCPPPIPEPAAVAIFAGDHGVHAQGVTPWPQEVTGQMVANFLGGGAVCNAFANQVGAEVCVVDVGVASDLPATPGLLPRKVRPGTADMTTGPALTREEVKQAIEVGIETARDLVAAGNKALLTGEMGIANTTASAALIAVYTDTDPSEVTGRGTGINDETLARKTEVVRRAIELHQPDPADPIGVLAAFGGLEHAAMVGLLLGGASLRTPVILDGVSAGAAALVARAIAPEALSACIAGHRSAEPGHVAALNKLGLRPLVDLDLRLGEGTGALLALPLVQSAARAMHEVATFDSAGVTEK
jgi:nicotinate-nucleotide--dimethylbenzimidazole phosphoribosyltransferase